MYRVRAMFLRLATNLLAVVCLLAGFALLTIAGGLVLARLYTPEFAFLVVGLGWLGGGLVLLAVGAQHHILPAQQPDLAAAFLKGFGAGSATRRGFDNARARHH